MAAIAIISLLTGYFYIVGANFCHYPKLMYITGAIVLGLWCGTCMNCFVLIINRLLDLSNKHMIRMIFKGYRMYVILLIPFVYSLFFTFFTPPMLFDSSHMAWIIPPFTSDTNNLKHYSHALTANNVFIVVTTCLLYIRYSRVILQSSAYSNGMTWGEKSFIIQTSFICTANFVVAMVYIYMQFLYTPNYLAVMAHIAWQLAHGFPAFVCLALNRTIQREVFQMLRISKRPLKIVNPWTGTMSTRVPRFEG
ncbi:hypothetical protein KIN20_001706 [Parelaphostrongylus tenuis]|uniref:Uncharacterized protein n=1 Tax=Parelaphostrongylus tenuis TaxID=148309 RepID=A0AAD5MCZ6_PARTN|nr:hypothetical protein KIN20_001706 [Parelaphostrongylus tenuis]